MNNRWTGGQYSLYRLLLGGTIVGTSLTAVSAQPLALLAATLGILLAVGWCDRLAAALLAGVTVLGGTTAVLQAPFFGLLLIHVATPPAPYGSWAARGRVDPGNGWVLPPILHGCAWLWFGYAAVMTWTAANGTFLPAAVLAALLALDPGWIAPRGPATERLFFDGNCGLCHRSVRFVLAEDRTGAAFRFAPLDSDALRSELTPEQQQTLPDSLVVLTADGKLLTRWRGMCHIAQRLGGVWRVLGTLAALVPDVIGNVLYDGLARIRHRLFTKPKDSCPILPPALRQRFDW